MFKISYERINIHSLNIIEIELFHFFVSYLIFKLLISYINNQILINQDF